MEVGEVPKGIRWSAEAGGPPKVRIGGVNGRGRGPTIEQIQTVLFDSFFFLIFL